MMSELSSALMWTLCAVVPSWKLSSTMIGAKMTTSSGGSPTLDPARPLCTRLDLRDQTKMFQCRLYFNEWMTTHCQLQVRDGIRFTLLKNGKTDIAREHSDLKLSTQSKRTVPFAFFQERMTCLWTSLWWEQKICVEQSSPTTARTSNWPAKALRVWWDNLGNL